MKQFQCNDCNNMDNKVLYIQEIENHRLELEVTYNDLGEWFLSDEEEDIIKSYCELINETRDNIITLMMHGYKLCPICLNDEFTLSKLSKVKYY